MKKFIYLLLFITIGLFISSCSLFHKDVEIVAKLQIIESDITTNNTKVSEEIVVHEGDLIELKDKQFYLCNREANDIKIVSIKDDYIVISREKLIYDNNVNKTYTKEIKENIEYNEEFSTSINESNPLEQGIACAQAKYYYYLMFVKN